MKKIRFILSTIVLCMAINVLYAQTEKGKFMIGAKSDMSLLFGSSKTEVTTQGQTVSNDGPKTTNFNIMPSAGYFFIDGLAGGIAFNLQFDHSKSEQTNLNGSSVDLNDNTTTFLIGPFVRYYFQIEKVQPFVQGNISFGSMKEKYDYFDGSSVATDDMKFNLLNWGLGAGVAFFLTDNVSIDGTLGYNNVTSTYKDGDNKSKGISNSFGFDFGFTIYLP